ncbi:hypothetical protein QN399_01035 [Pseudomonas sp. 10C3]|uniref:hypothetical protein n=1 Tax=Pseudomonas sp. 10C3 TaxID=3118753 RepID=UPI002E82276C|nr:hypothetical protein [Pseudomonas sp. 10C3]MEE3504860.1 hypothetical protein [Pseudomonas sp. 10C3]
MSESKMHQSFEAFYGFKWMSVSDTAQQAWAAAWQASREALVIELPKAWQTNVGGMLTPNGVRFAIESAGLKVKS